MSRFIGKTFIDRYFNGDVLLEEIDDYVEKWHTSDYDCELYEFLGLTEEEYNLWTENDFLLTYIIEAKIKKQNVVEFLKNISKYQLAARATSANEAVKVKDWLIKTERIKKDNDN